ncbi:MAG: hypothetical protein KJP08_03840 [Gammaproteobacteria bacterium]|nr:hypothetical protein [Gammaproteobacteria bacterium]NNF48305.1 hypothetical protein [Woeseiaceae bacterium]MBT8093919.1 hypothetical protein [Gammaproteobacteria bacterium]MBT8105495.1 hypothetical protein [Gammaproteobacteria bacterium]NNK25509.1 hypothetical protein [Woeseiaceae bacterium]
MSSDFDPRLQALFAEARKAFDREAFTRDVMAQIDAGRRRTVVVWAVAATVTVVVLIFLAAPVLTALRLVTELLPVSVVEIQSDWMKQLLAPVNSVAALIAVLALGIRKFYRRIFG